MKYYTLVIRTLYKNMPDSVYSDDHLVFDNLDTLNDTVEKVKGMITLKAVRIEESAFKDGQLKCKKVLKVFKEESEYDEE